MLKLKRFEKCLCRYRTAQAFFFFSSVRQGISSVRLCFSQRTTRKTSDALRGGFPRRLLNDENKNKKGLG